jgi:hypothetical protein
MSAASIPAAARAASLAAAGEEILHVPHHAAALFASGELSDSLDQ